MTRVEKLLISRRHAKEETSFCWSPFPENDEEVSFHDETRRYRADASKYTFTNIY